MSISVYTGLHRSHHIINPRRIRRHKYLIHDFLRLTGATKSSLFFAGSCQLLWPATRDKIYLCFKFTAQLNLHYFREVPEIIDSLIIFIRHRAQFRLKRIN